jgi:hypothetical protein
MSDAYLFKEHGSCSRKKDRLIFKLLSSEYSKILINPPNPAKLILKIKFFLKIHLIHELNLAGFGHMLLPSQSNGGFAKWMEIKIGMWIFHQCDS